MLTQVEMVLTYPFIGEDGMRRRAFIAGLGGAAMWPLVARAQQSAMLIIGFMSARSPEDSAHNLAAFQKGLQESGFTDGQNVKIEYRWARGDYARLPMLAAELVARPVDVIATAGGTAPALAARDATATIPIVFVVGTDPVKAGLVNSLNRPAGNLTGVTLTGSALAAKRIELLHELIPGARRVAVMVNSTLPATAGPQAADAERAARALGLEVIVLSASTPSDLEQTFDALAKQRVGALFVTNDAFFLSERDRLIALTTRHGLPAIFESREFSDAGGLSSYGTNTAEMHRQLGVYAGRVLKGAKPADLPVMQPTKFEWIINLKTAKAIGLEVPPMLLARADEVIE
jgi:putative ABC transport system substrate-binding protein